MLTLKVVVTPEAIELLELLWAVLLMTEELASLEDAGVELGATEDVGVELAVSELAATELGATLVAVELGATLAGVEDLLPPPPPPPQATRLITTAVNKPFWKHLFTCIEAPEL